MQVISPKVDILPEIKPLEKIELCGRVCYKSEDKIEEGSARRFAERILSRGHTSVFEHTRVIIPHQLFRQLRETKDITSMPAVERVSFYYTEHGDVQAIGLNGRDFINFVSDDLTLLNSLAIEDGYMSVRFTCDRAIANELVRHRVFSFSSESTRYVNYKDGINFILPVPFDWADINTEGPTEIPDAFADPRYQEWYFLCEEAEKAYQKMLAEGCTPQEARDVLPLSTKTELIMTGTYPQWREMLKLRMAPSAHPQMRYLMDLLTKHEQFPSEILNEEKENADA